jgi:hypothetical protein
VTRCDHCEAEVPVDLLARARLGMVDEWCHDHECGRDFWSCPTCLMEPEHQVWYPYWRTWMDVPEALTTA